MGKIRNIPYFNMKKLLSELKLAKTQPDCSDLVTSKYILITFISVVLSFRNSFASVCLSSFYQFDVKNSRKINTITEAEIFILQS